MSETANLPKFKPGESVWAVTDKGMTFLKIKAFTPMGTTPAYSVFEHEFTILEAVIDYSQESALAKYLIFRMDALSDQVRRVSSQLNTIEHKLR